MEKNNKNMNLQSLGLSAIQNNSSSLKQAGMSLEAISEALTHSDTGTTQIYVNTSNVVPMAVGEFALKSLKQ